MSKRLVLILFSTLFLLHHSFAQEDEFRKAYEDFKKQAKGKYADFRQKCNAEYAEFLKQAWENYKKLPAIPRPKDETVPPVKRSEGDETPIKNDEVPIDEVVIPTAPEPQPLPVSPIYEDKTQEGLTFAFRFFGTECKARIPKDKTFHLSSVDGEQIGKAWELLTKGDYDNTIRDFLELRIRMRLCDWAYLNVINTFAESYLGKGNDAILLTAFLYCQSGYQMRLASTSGGHLYLLFGSKHRIYEMPYYNIDGVAFYPFTKDDINNVEICGAAFPDEKSMSLYIHQGQVFANNATPLRMLTAERYPEMQIQVQVNKNLIGFYNTYPTSDINDNFMTRWAMYANTPMQQEVQATLYPKLKQYLTGDNELVAVNKLLNWVQTAFVYEYDDKVWGHDRAFFAEESLYYPYCDCEDRSILFTRLVRDLLGLDCILIYYPGHLASAVCFNGQVNGDYISLNGRKFVISDATYIGAPVGMTMPDMDNVSTKVILLER